MDKWFTIDQIDEGTYIISEYRHWEETHCYLLNGSSRSLLIDTGLGICNIYDEVVKLTNNDYAEGFSEGIKTLGKCKKVPFRPEHIGNYLQIEWELFTGTLLYVWEFLKRRLKKLTAI